MEWMTLPGWADMVPGLLYALAVLLFVVGMLGCVLPYPGHLVILCGCMVWAYAGESSYDWLWPVLVVLALLGSFADNICTLLGARKAGCSRWAFWGSVVGIVVGIFFFPLGLVVGPFLGAFAGQLISGSGVKRSTGTAFAVLLGTLLGMAAKFIIAGLMLLLFFLY